MFFYFDSLSLVLSAFRDSVFSIAESNPVTGRSSLFLRAVNMFRQGGARSSPNRRFIIYLSPWHVDAFWIFITDYGANWWAPFVLMHMSAFKLQENKNCSYQYFSFSHFMILNFKSKGSSKQWKMFPSLFSDDKICKFCQQYKIPLVFPHMCMFI